MSSNFLAQLWSHCLRLSQVWQDGHCSALCICLIQGIALKGEELVSRYSFAQAFELSMITPPPPKWREERTQLKLFPPGPAVLLPVALSDSPERDMKLRAFHSFFYLWIWRQWHRRVFLFLFFIFIFNYGLISALPEIPRPISFILCCAIGDPTELQIKGTSPTFVILAPGTKPALVAI